MANFIYKEPRIYKDPEDKKWCIRYSIQYPGDDKFYPRKEYGENYLGQQLNRIQNPKEREERLFDVLRAVKKDLSTGVDPKNPVTVVEYVKKQTESTHKYTFDYCF